MWKLTLAILFLIPFSNAKAITLDDSIYYDNEDVSITGLTGDSRNLWLYPVEGTSDCRYPQDPGEPCSPGATASTGDLPLVAQDDGGSQKTFGTAVILWNGNEFTIVETNNSTDCSPKTLAECLALSLDDATFTMTTSTPGGTSTSTPATMDDFFAYGYLIIRTLTIIGASYIAFRLITNRKQIL